MDFNTFLKKSKEQTVRPELSVAAPDTGYFTELGAKTAAPTVSFSTPVAPTSGPLTGFERIGSTVSGGLKGSGAGFTNTLGTLLEGLGNLGSKLQDKKEEKLAAQDAEYIKLYEKQLADAKASGDEKAARIAEINLNQARYRLKNSGKLGDLYDEINKQATTDVYAKADQLAESSTKDIEKAKEGLGTVGKFFVDAGVAGTQLAGDIALGVATGTGAAAPIFIRGFGSGAQQARQEGADLNKQVAYGLASAVLEVATEKLSSVGNIQTNAFGSGAADDILKGIVSAVEDLGKTPAGKKALNHLASAGVGFISEGAEEAISGMVDPILKKVTYAPDSDINWKQTMHDAAYEFLVGGVLGGVMGGAGGTNTTAWKAEQQSEPTTKQTPVDKTVEAADNKPTEVSPAAEPQVQQIAQQETVTKAENPESNVLDTATTMYVQQGMNLKTAQMRAEIVSRLIAGEEVSVRDINRLEPTNPKSQAIFTQLTGVQFPEGRLTTEQLYNLYRSAHDVAIQAQEARVAQVAAEQAAAKQAEVGPVDIAAEQVAAKQAEVGPNGERGVDYATFAEAYKSQVNPGATDAEIQAKYQAFQSDTKARAEQKRDTLTLSNGREMTRKQFKNFMRAAYAERGETTTDEGLDAFFNMVQERTEKGQPMPYDESMEAYMKEDTQDGSTEDMGRAESSSGARKQESAPVLDQPGGRRERGTHRPGKRPAQGDSEALRAGELTEARKIALELRAQNIPTVETDFGAGMKPIQVIPEDHYTPDMREFADWLGEQAQCRVVYCMGPIETMEGFRAAGMYDTKSGVIFLQADTDGRYTFQQNGLHELFHKFDYSDSELSMRVLSAVAKAMRVDDINLIGRLIQSRYEPKYKVHYGLFEDNSYEYYGEFLADLYSGIDARTRMGEIFQPCHEAAVKAVEEWQAERDAAQQNTENKNSDSSGDRVFSATTDLTWEEQLETMDDLEETSALYIEETPNILAEVGLGDLPLCMTRQHLRDVMHEKSESNAHWHGVSEDVIKRLPELLSRPVMVMNSHTRPGDIVVLLDVIDADGLPIVASIHPNGHATVDGVRGPANFITSVYPRTNFSRSAGQPSKNNMLYLALANRSILYWHEKRTKALFQRVGLQLPYTMEKVPSDTILKQHQGYVKSRIPTRLFSAADEDYTSYGLPEITSWSQAFTYFDSFDVKSKWQISFDMPPGFGPEMDLCLLDSKGKWLENIASYPNTAAGLQEFLAELPSFLENAADVANVTSKTQEASKKLDELMAKVDEYFGEDAENDDFLPSDEDWYEIEGGFDETWDDAPDYDLMSDLQNDREGFTRTDTKAFKAWHHDDSGELTLADGRPKVFLRGTVNAGATKARDHNEANSLGTFFTDDEGIARFYSQGMSVSPDKKDTLMDFLTGKTQDIGQEWKPKYCKGWGPARDYVKNTFSFDGHGFRLTPVKDGKPVQASRADGFRLETTMASQEDREATGVYEHAGQLRELAYYPKNSKGLEQFNHEFGDIVRAEGMGIRAIGKFYLSAKKTLVVDAEGYSYKGIPNSLLPLVIRSDKATNVSHINGIVARAFNNGYDCVVVKDVDDVGDVQNQYIVKNSSQIKSVYNRGTWSESDPDYLFSAAEDSPISNFLRGLEEEYGEGSAQKMFEAFENLERSRQAAVKMAESTGAAPSGFDPYSHLQNEYGTIEPGEKPARVIDSPARTKPWNKVSMTPRTVMEAKATPDERIPTIEEAILDDKFSYVEDHNKIQVNRANAYIQKKGWAEAVAEWQKDVRDGKVNADLVARGAVILNNAGNSDMDGKRYISLLTDYTDLLRAATQGAQASRILKNLSPTGRLYQIQAYTDRANERIRPDNSAHNIPVEQWMQRTGELLADRLRTAVGGTRKQALTTAQTILSDLNKFARESFPEAEKTPGRTEMDRIQDLFNNYDNYREAWEAAKETIREQYADQPDALAAFENFLETDLAEAFLGRYFDHPEVRISPELSQKFLDAKTDTERDAVIDEIIKDIARQIPATKMDKFTALRYLNMLGNLKTQGRNILGNLFNLGLTKAKNQVATVLELGANAVGIKVERTKSFTKDKDTYKAALADFEPMKEIILSGGKYQDGKKFDQRIEDQRQIFNNKFLEGYRKATNRAMTQGDLVFSKAAYADALAGYLAAHNVTFETADTATLDAARNYAVQQAAEATFRDSNAFSDAISSMRFRNPDTWAKKGLNLLSEGLLPFRKTPANILVRAVEYSPVGVLTTAAEAVYGKRKTGSVDGSKVIDSLAKNLTGTGILVLGYVLANSGLLKGKGSDDEKEKDFDELTGHQSYSIELPNGLSLTLDWLAPSSIPLFLGAQMAETAAEEGLTFRTGLEALGAITDPMLQMSMLQGLDDALSNASTYGDDSALVRFTGNALWSFATQGLTNTMLGQLERSLKNERSTTYRDKNKDLPDGIQYLLGKTGEKIPLPRVDYGQIPYIDAWGRTEQNARTDVGNVVNQFLNPSYTSWVNESDMEDELRRLSKVDSAVLISRPKSYFNVDNERRDLTGEEYVEYATTRGQTAYNVTTDLTESRMYAGLTDKQKAEAVVKVYDFANQLAKATVTGYDASKWGTEPPEGAAVPDKWVVNAATAATEYGIPVADFVTAYVVASDAESYKNKNGKTVDNSESLKKAVAIYNLGLSDAQTKKLMEDLGVNETVRGWSEQLARNKLAQMDKNYG